MNENERKKKTVKGVKWSMLSQLVIQFSNILISVILTSLLTPEDFGLIAMVTVFVGFLSVYQDFGLGSSLIYKKNTNDLDYNSVFYAHLSLGFILSLILFFSRDLIAKFYNQNMLIPITSVISISFIIQSLSYIQYTLLKKKMDFKSIFFVESISVVISGTIAIIMAYVGYGVWSIVTKLLIFSLLRTLLYWFLGKWKPKLIFSKSSLKEALDYSLPIAGNRTIGYAMRSVDNLLIGRFLGVVPLGVYSRAYALMMLPVSQVSAVLVNVLFPSFALIRDDKKKFALDWLKINKMLSFFLFPLSTLIIINARSFVLFFLGEEWEGVILLIQILSFAGAAQAITNIGYVFESLGLTKLNFKINLIVNVALILSIIIGLKFGVIGVSIAYTITTVVFVPILRWTYIKKCLHIPILKIIKTLNPYLIISLLWGGLIYFVSFYYIENFSFLLDILVKSTMFIVGYLLILNFFKDKTIHLVISKLKS